MSIDEARVKNLRLKVNQLRHDIYVTTSHIGYAHMGGGMSMLDIVTAIYYDKLNFDPKNPRDPDRDRFILSKGHCAHVLYNIFIDKGMYTKEEVWSEYNKINGRFGMHPNYHYIPGIDASTGSLGQGLALSVGIALAGRMDKKNYRVFCVVGDGELQEGSNWEAIMASSQYQLGNLVAVVDNNHVESCGRTEQINKLEPVGDKFRAFGWDVISIEDGHDMKQILEALDQLPPSDSQIRRKPICIIANTIKGKTIPGLEDNPISHLIPVKEEMLEKALAALDREREEIERS